jgi:hypothetical protein
MIKRTYLDCEFIRNDFRPQGLISLGIECDGETYYAVNAEADMSLASLDEEARQWVRDNVFPHLPICEDGRLDLTHPDVKPYATIRDEVDTFYKNATGGKKASKTLRLIADHGPQDVVRLHTLWDNDWGVIPVWIPKKVDYDLGTLEDDLLASRPSFMASPVMPEQNPNERHHALRDAQHDRAMHEFLMGASR